MPSLRQYARLIEDCERRALQGEADADEAVPLFMLEEDEQRAAGEDPA